MGRHLCKIHFYEVFNLKVVFSREGGVWRRQCLAEEVMFSRADCV